MNGAGIEQLLLLGLLKRVFFDSVFISRDKRFVRNASRLAPTLLWHLHHLVSHQFEPLDQRET